MSGDFSPFLAFGVGYNRVTVHHPVHTVVTAPASPNDLAVSLVEVKAHLGYPAEDTSRDAELTGFIRAAMAAVESYCQLTLLETVWRADVPELCAETLLRKRPFKAFTKIEYVRASDREIVTIDALTYHVLPYIQRRARVFLGDGLDWPDDDAIRADAFRLTYTAGWTIATLPWDIKNALLQIVAKFDASRGDCDGGGGDVSVYAMKNSNASPFPPAASALLDPYRLQEVWTA